MHITITGNLGSGKSTICKILEDKYGFEIYSTGKVQREIAREMNLTTLEMNQLMCSDRKYDTMIDDATARISRENRDKNIIFDSRLAWHFVEQSFKIFLSVSLDIAAKRVMNDNRGKEEKYSTLEEAKELLSARAATEDKRYRDMYNLEYFNFTNYNLVLDSSMLTPEQLASIIMTEAKNFEAIMKDNKSFLPGNQGINRILMSPKRLYQPSDEELVSVKNNLEDRGINKGELQKNSLKNSNQNRGILEKEILVRKDCEKFTILEGKEEILCAIASEVLLVPVKIVE